MMLISVAQVFRVVSQISDPGMDCTRRLENTSWTIRNRCT